MTTTAKPLFDRVVVKLSGEALMGPDPFGLNAPTVARMAVDLKAAADLGEDFGNGLTAREVDYFVREEWARSADDVLWRRSKCGLGMGAAKISAVAACVARSVAAVA